ncbi:Predicted chitinase [Micromonospora pattaloongensis]|uniref:Predicted chitinase n=1 Tax=Micromonospora pattaloongensis TaxID=405436 RepID=A0A1H3NIK7_9ACTN|nr:glycoside hydrolase family 19 protein [Micromonospora pattaloongensis]SDY88520.1 Predicted chitinase [Micromonospora pattaloongensis]
MSKARTLVALAAIAAAGALAAILPMRAASAADCAPAWNASAVYTGGNTVSHNGRNWSAKWWTQGEAPPGSSGVWADQGACGPSTPGPVNPGASAGFVVSEAQFNQMFPSRNSFYTYGGLTAALSAYPGFANTGSDTTKRQEAAAFLANVNHETGGLVHVVEQNTANYPHYCDASQPYGCPAGQAAYYGRGPIQLSWNFNYKAAGDALGLPLLTNPWLVQNDSAVAWKTALWFWNTQSGAGTMTPHNAMVNGRGFGETIRSINGSLECGGRNPAQVQSRINAYQRFVGILGTTPGGNLSC